MLSWKKLVSILSFWIEPVIYRRYVDDTFLLFHKYTIKDSFTFAEKLQSFDSKLVMASFDIEFSLLTFLRTHIDNLSKDTLRELLTRTPLVLFDHEIYKQHDGVAMGSNWGLHLLMLFFVIMKKIGFSIGLLNWTCYL